MNLEALLAQIDGDGLRAFVKSAREVIDALMIEARDIKPAEEPELKDYNTRRLDRSSPAGGWLDSSELRATNQALSEAIAAENWVRGATVALRLFSMMG